MMRSVSGWRRSGLVGTVCLAGLAVGFGCASQNAGGGDGAARAAQAEPDRPTTPDEVIAELRRGNERFVSGRAVHINTSLARVQETAAHGQHPFATVITCADSRVPVETLFDRGVGDLFVIRVAGNVSQTDEIASMEYAVGHLHTPVVFVMGHTACGAVGAACADAELGGSLPQLIRPIKPAVAEAKQQSPDASGPDLVNLAVRYNVQRSMHDILMGSAEIAEAVRTGHTRVIGAVYHLESGRVEILGEHPQQAALLERAPTRVFATAEGGH